MAALSAALGRSSSAAKWRPASLPRASAKHRLLLLLVAAAAAAAMLTFTMMLAEMSHERSAGASPLGTGAADDDDRAAAVTAFTGRRLLQVPHPWGAHAAFESFRCADSGGDGAAQPRGRARWSWQCLCAAQDRIAPACFPTFDPSDLAQRAAEPPAPEPRLMAEDPRSGLHAAPASALVGLSNILIISMDTARADVFPFNGAAPPPTVLAGVRGPSRAEALLRRHVNHATHPGRVYRRAFATAPWTLPSHASLLTGFAADATGVYDDDHMIKVPQLGHHLGPDYCKVAYVSNQNLLPDGGPSPVDGPAARPFDHVRSFGWNGTAGAWDQYAYWRRPEDAEAASAAFLRQRQPDHQPLSAAATALPACASNASQPFFLFAHTNRVHDYGLDPQRYLAHVAATDTVLADLLDLVDFATTIVVLTSDHGEGFEPELGRLVHTGRVHQDLMHTSLVVWHPAFNDEDGEDSDADEGVARRTVDAPVSLISVVPSLLAWTGHSFPPYLAGPLLPRRSHGLRRATTTVAGVDQSYAFALLPHGPHAWLAPFDVLVGPTANNWNRRHVAAADTEVRMTVAWPLKRITSRINGVLHYAAYDLVDDPHERVNLLDAGLLPTVTVASASSAGVPDATPPPPPSLPRVGDFYGRMAGIVAAIQACSAMRTAGYVLPGD